MPSSLHEYVVWFVAVLFVCASPCAHSQSQPVLAEFKLKDYGWHPPPPRAPHEWAGSSGQPIAIDHKGRILIGYTAREAEGLATRQDPKLSFHIIRLTREGKVDISLTLPTNNWRSAGIYLGAEDHILARASESLQMLTGDDQTPAHPMWKVLAPCSMNCRISQSPSRRTLIIRDRAGYTVLDTSTSEPHVVQRCSSIGGYAERITDKYAYESGSNGTDYFTRRWTFCDKDHPDEMPLTVPGDVRPLNDELFGISGVGTSKSKESALSVISGDGRIKFQLQMPKGDISESVVGDERGDRFAASVATWHGGSSFLDISGNRVARRIIVFESQSGQQLADVPVSAHNPIIFQLSPDGHRLAILQDEMLKVADLK